MNVNKQGRSYHSGKALHIDLRGLIIDRCLRYGVDQISGYLPVQFKALGEELGVSGNTVAKIWCNYCFNDYSRKLSDGDLELIEMLKTTQGSIQLREIYTTLEDVGDIAGGVSMSTISRAVKSRLLSGKQYTRKRITHVAKERFTDDNMIYTQWYIKYLSSKDPKRIKFFDEAGVKTPDIGTRLYGNAPSGERCVEIARKTE